MTKVCAQFVVTIRIRINNKKVNTSKKQQNLDAEKVVRVRPDVTVYTLLALINLKLGSKAHVSLLYHILESTQGTDFSSPLLHRHH